MLSTAPRWTLTLVPVSAQGTWADARPTAPRTKPRFLRVASAPVGPAPEEVSGKGSLATAVVVALQKTPSLRSVTHVSSVKAADELMEVSRLQSQSSFTRQIRQRVTGALKNAGIDLLDNDSASIKSLWGVFDANGDGVIDFKEFCQFTTDLLNRRRRKSGMKAMTVLEAKFVRLVTRETRR